MEMAESRSDQDLLGSLRGSKCWAAMGLDKNEGGRRR